jgi:hypothetical protein
MTVPCSHGMPSPASCTDCMYEGNLAPVGGGIPDYGSGGVW